ncbi:MAG: acyl-CoA dehydratase activase [Firmicutes bacterium]|nr:acyl-CoA dehydratase activase [Bacillota bacterium]
MYRIGLDVGSTTLKCIVLNDANEIVYKSYERHLSLIFEKTIELLQEIKNKLGEDIVSLNISGSAGMGMANHCSIPFTQEVFATKIAANTYLPGTDVIIELGGEDAKILFTSNCPEVRMNGACAGGTGAFIDQMATLLDVSADGINELAKSYEKLYTIASRCGVFAKSDIQPLINQGAQKNDIAASILYAVVNQTIAGLAQGRKIKGNVVYLGGPLTFLSELRRAFDKTLGVTGTLPENSLYYVSLGAALSCDRTLSIDETLEKLRASKASGNYRSLEPLFKNQDEYREFVERHSRSTIKQAEKSSYKNGAYIGIDSGSTTIKAALINTDGELLKTVYCTNKGNPIPTIKQFIEEVYAEFPGIKIISSAVTGYGEDIIKSAFDLDYGVVETIAHFTAAKFFMPNVDFIIDIGGQDIKCFKIKDGVIDNIFLNEACSSGCGSFLQTFAQALGSSIEDFAKKGLESKHPVDLGSRCTVFMNSSVKQAQKDGAKIEDISAGLSISVVKNALYKVIRATSRKDLGDHIVVQGGTFLNDSVLRAFEKELELEVIRPSISGLMGAYGAALYAKSMAPENSVSHILDGERIKNFTHTVKTVNCGLCQNNCRLTVNTFDSGRKYIGNNRCERPITKKSNDDSLNLFAYKLKLLSEYKPCENAPRGKIGLPMGLNMYELLPFWHTFFTKLGFEVITSGLSDRELYLNGQTSIPSDTVCFPAKLIHGHIERLVSMGLKTIFYPCMSYNLDEKMGDNHYNCPVVAYYPEVIGANMSSVKDITYINEYVGIHRRKDFPKKIHSIMEKYFGQFSGKEIAQAVDAAYLEYNHYMLRIKDKGEEIVKTARENGMNIIVLCGRPYHLDPEINHGIDRLIISCGAALITEDSLRGDIEHFPVHVLNQWTYHSRLYAAAKYVSDKPDMNIIQLVSFGCGVDAITTDEMRDILEKAGKIYTQIKIDEITNLGAVKIRIRSLFAALEQEKKNAKGGRS